MSSYSEFESMPAPELLSWAYTTYGQRFAVVTSFQSGGMVLVDMAARLSSDMRVITLDTGRLPDETHQMLDTVQSRYGLTIEILRPDEREVEVMVGRFGRDLFYDSVAMRALCCQVRKVRPFERKMHELDAWASGLRRSQSADREEIGKVMEDRGTLKISPLADWSKRDVEEYLDRHQVPRHPLYARGYTSIGCGPCTRAVGSGEGERAGRWWWETEAKKECGLHFTPDGRAERTVDVLLREVITNA